MPGRTIVPLLLLVGWLAFAGCHPAAGKPAPRPDAEGYIPWEDAKRLVRSSRGIQDSIPVNTDGVGSGYCTSRRASGLPEPTPPYSAGEMVTL